MSEIVVIGGGFGGTWFAKAVGAVLLTRSNGHDINRDAAWWNDALRILRPKCVVNFASQSMVGQSWDNPEHWMQTNCVGISGLLRALENQVSLERYIHFTTPEVYGSTPCWTKEHWNFAPSTPYAVSRAAGDWMVKLWHQQYGFPAIFTRAANIYGEGQQLYRLIPKAILAKMEGKAFPLHGGGSSLRSFVHMDDVTDALNLLIEMGVVGETYHISPREDYSVTQVVDMIGCNTAIATDRPGKDEAYLLDSAKIMDLGWVPKVTLDRGLQRVEEWMRANRDAWANWPREYEHRE